MQEKTKSTLNKLPAKSLELAKNMRDVRLLGLTIFVGVALLVTWSGVSVIQTNYELQQRIARLEQENQLQQLKNENLKLKNQYYQTDRYLELEARRNFGKAAPGETVVLVPETVALAHVKDLPEETAAEAVEKTADKPAYQKNFEAWMEFLFRRNYEEI